MYCSCVFSLRYTIIIRPVCLVLVFLTSDIKRDLSCLYVFLCLASDMQLCDQSYMYMCMFFLFLASDIQCDQAYMGRVGHGVIHSYNYPFAYRHNLTCTHRIYLNNQPGQSSSTICFTFHRFLLETSTPYCSFDSLKIDNIKYCGLGLWQYGGMDTESSDANVWNTDFCCKYSIIVLLATWKLKGWISNFLKLEIHPLTL